MFDKYKKKATHYPKKDRKEANFQIAKSYIQSDTFQAQNSFIENIHSTTSTLHIYA